MRIRPPRRSRRVDEQVTGIHAARRSRSWTGPRPLTDIDRPDSINVVRHAAPLQLSSAADWELEMAQWVDGLAAAGALDPGTPYVADEMIRTRLAAELALVDAEARDAHVTNSMLAGVDQENLQRAQVRLADLRDRDVRLRAEIADHTAQLGGTTTADAVSLPATDHRPPATALQLRPLPRAADLTALLPPTLHRPFTPAPSDVPTTAPTQETR